MKAGNNENKNLQFQKLPVQPRQPVHLDLKGIRREVPRRGLEA